jgi:hypothetical protein
MKPARVAAAVLVSLTLASAALAQSEFGRVSGGSLDVLTKHRPQLSGSFELSAARGFSKGYNATLGGTIVPDRLWFFASADRSTPTFAQTNAVDAKVLSQLGDRQNLAASFGTSHTQLVETPAATFPAPLPSQFLTLHYTGIISNNMFVTASFSELRRTN